MADGALVVDLREMRTVTVDPRAATGSSRRRGALAGRRCGHDRARPGHDGGNVRGHRYRRSDPDRRDRGADGDGRVHVRQPRACRRRHRGWQRRRSRARAGTRNCCGPSAAVAATSAWSPSSSSLSMCSGRLQLARFATHLDHAPEALQVVADLARNSPPELVLWIGGPAPEELPNDGTPPGPTTHLRIGASTRARSPTPRRPSQRCATVPGISGGFALATYPEVQASSGTSRSACATTGRVTSSAISSRRRSIAVVDAMRDTPGGHSFMLLEAISGQARTEPHGRRRLWSA